MKTITVYWDHSHIWGFLLWHSLHSLEIPFKLLSSKDISKQLLDDTSLLIVPGGSARLKASSLGTKGKKAVKDFLAEGGKYLGFCGGAGLALSTKEGLALCPWKRSSFSDRLLHHISGHLFVHKSEHFLLPTSEEDTAILPVWFPARFEVVETQEEQPLVLARYGEASKDFYMSDLPLSLFTQEYSHESMALYGIDLDPHLRGEPASILGKYAKGEYILSYAHLETPYSHFANNFYFNILENFAGIKNDFKCVPQLDLDLLEVKWEDNVLEECSQKLMCLLDFGMGLGLLFRRTPWLIGWKQGLQGGQLANLRMALFILRSLSPDSAMRAKWEEESEKFSRLFKLFYEGVHSFFYAQRLCLSLTDVLSTSLLVDQQTRLFGKAMEMGGICGELVDILESVFLMQYENKERLSYS